MKKRKKTKKRRRSRALRNPRECSCLQKSKLAKRWKSKRIKKLKLAKRPR